MSELRQIIDAGKKRISEMYKLFSSIYKDNILGKLDDNRYARMTGEYEKEQKELYVAIVQTERAFNEASTQAVDYRLLYQGFEEFLEMKELTPEIVKKSSFVFRFKVRKKRSQHRIVSK